jgi:glycosyltransferase involved in cell wall biosynthesis
MTYVQGLPRLAIVSETFYPDINGISHMLKQLILKLQVKYQIEVIRTEQVTNSVPFSEIHNSRIDELTIPGMSILGYSGLGLPCTNRLLKRWRTYTPDFIYIATEGPLGWSALNAAEKLNIPVLSSFHTHFTAYSSYSHEGIFKKLMLLYLRRFHQRAAGTLVATPSMQALLKLYGFDNIHILSRGVDCSQFSPAYRDRELRASWGLGPEDNAILYVGRLATEKNMALAIATFQRLAQTRSGLKFVLVGDGPLRKKLEAQYPHFIFCGEKTDQDLARHYASGDIFLFPSKTEIFGNVVLEAMASGLGVIAFNDAAAHELINHKVNGMLVPLQNDHRFIDNAITLIHQPSLLKELRLQARERVLEWHWSKVAMQFEQYLHQIKHHQIGARKIPSDELHNSRHLSI